MSGIVGYIQSYCNKQFQRHLASKSLAAKMAALAVMAQVSSWAAKYINHYPLDRTIIELTTKCTV